MSKIPTNLTEQQFMDHIDPYLSQAKRGFAGHLPRYKVFNYILYWLHTGGQWEEIPIASVPGSEKKKSVTVPFIPFCAVEPGWKFKKSMAPQHFDHPS